MPDNSDRLQTVTGISGISHDETATAVTKQSNFTHWLYDVKIKAVVFSGLRDGTPFFDVPTPPEWLVEALEGPEGNEGSIWVRYADEQAPAALMVGTIGGSHVASPGDVIIRWINGEISLCKARIFAASYDPVR